MHFRPFVIVNNVDIRWRFALLCEGEYYELCVAVCQMEEAEQRQKVLLDVMKKELSHNQRMVTYLVLYSLEISCI